MSDSAGVVVILAVAATVAAAQIPSRYSELLTVYHVHPANASAVPANMNTGDVPGDLSFYLRKFLVPLECEGAEAHDRRDCRNPELVDPNLVVSRVELEVDSRMTNYSACNVCNGTDPYSRKPCERNGTYVCACHTHVGHLLCDPNKVGRENISDRLTPHTPPRVCRNAMQEACGKVSNSSQDACFACLRAHDPDLSEAGCGFQDLTDFCGGRSGWLSCTASDPPWRCWVANIPRKTSGFWYNTPKAAQCVGGAVDVQCSWRVRSVRTVKEGCLTDHVVAPVLRRGASCFQACASTAANCWLACFFDTILGVDARNSSSRPIGGMPLEELEGGWRRAFLDEADGGCKPALSELSEVVPAPVVV